MFQLTLALAYAIALLGLNMLTGYNGQISLGHGAFYAIGAYTAAILMDRFGVPYWLTLPAAAAVCLVAGFLFGLPALRLEGLYLALATFALALATPQLLKSKHVEQWTGGVQGIVILKPDAPFGLPLDQDQWLYFFTLAVAALMFLLAWNLLRGRIGRALVAIRDHPIAAEAMGVDISLYKALTFGVSAMYTGVGGALGAIAVQFVAPDSFTLFLSITLPGRHRRRRPRLDLRRDLGRALHPVRAQRRRPDLEGGALGDLRRVPDRLHVPDAGRESRAARARRLRRLKLDDRVRAELARSRTRTPGGEPGCACCTAAALAARRLALAAGSRRWRRRNTIPGATDTEIKIGNDALQRPGVRLRRDRQGDRRLLRQDQRRRAASTAARSSCSALDDGYSPPKAVEQTRRLVEQEQVLLIFQSLGTPSNTAIQKYMNAKKVPQLFVATGATKWGDPKNFPWTMGWQPNYQTEGKIYARYILETKPNAKIAVLYQNDDYGKDYLKGLKDGLGDKGQADRRRSHVRSQRPDRRLPDRHPEGVRGRHAASTSRRRSSPRRRSARCYDIGWKPLHYLNNVSNSVGSVLAPAGLDKAVGILITVAYYLKDPTDPQWVKDAGYLEWLAWMKKYNPDGNLTDTFNVYGYTVAQTLAQVLKQCGDDLTRENIMKQAANLDFELPMLLPGIRIKTSPDDFFPIEQEQLARWDGKTWVLFGKTLGPK